MDGNYCLTWWQRQDPEAVEPATGDVIAGDAQRPRLRGAGRGWVSRGPWIGARPGTEADAKFSMLCLLAPLITAVFALDVGGDKAVVLWDVASGQVVRKFRGHVGECKKGLIELICMWEVTGIRSLPPPWQYSASILLPPWPPLHQAPSLQFPNSLISLPLTFFLALTCTGNLAFVLILLSRSSCFAEGEHSAV